MRPPPVLCSSSDLFIPASTALFPESMALLFVLAAVCVGCCGVREPLPPSIHLDGLEQVVFHGSSLVLEYRSVTSGACAWSRIISQCRLGSVTSNTSGRVHQHALGASQLVPKWSDP